MSDSERILPSSYGSKAASSPAADEFFSASALPEAPKPANAARGSDLIACVLRISVCCSGLP